MTRLEGGTYFAEITLDTASGRKLIDARPSDSIALAMRTGAPIFVSNEVWTQAGVVLDQTPEADQESEIAEFSHFLDTVDPEDFRG